MKKSFVIALLLCLMTAICFIFWHTEYIYSLPTKKPEKYVEVAVGRKIKLPIHFSNNKPVFLHFFNPDCPCSRFNMSHFKALARQYSEEVNFVIIIMTDNKSYTEKRIHEKYGLNIPVLADSALAVETGVYSTPQAVILDSKNQLYYRGNYNKSRYCTTRQTDFARISLDSLLAERQRPLFDPAALRAYGCGLPNVKKRDDERN